MWRSRGVRQWRRAMGLEIRESFLNRDSGEELGETPYWATPYERASHLYVWLRAEYGRCECRLWQQDGEGVWQCVGGRFVQRVPYDDAHRVWPTRMYVRVVDVEVRAWVELASGEGRGVPLPPVPDARGAA